MLSIQAIKRTYVKNTVYQNIYILHTVKHLNESISSSVHFHLPSIYKSLTKNYLVILSAHFISKQMAYPGRDRKTDPWFLGIFITNRLLKIQGADRPNDQSITIQILTMFSILTLTYLIHCVFNSAHFTFRIPFPRKLTIHPI